MRFAYIYFMVDSPGRVGEVIPQHVAYWRGLALDGYLGGPFGDRSGGLITFGAGSSAEAVVFVAKDPFLREGLIASYWLKQWAIE
jgi:hypothetical protein